MTWIEVINNLILVGFGALVAALSNILVTQNTQRHQQIQERNSSLRDITDEFASNYAHQTENLLKFANAVFQEQSSEITPFSPTLAAIFEKYREDTIKLLLTFRVLQGRLRIYKCNEAADTLESIIRIFIEVNHYNHYVCTFKF